MSEDVSPIKNGDFPIKRLLVSVHVIFYPQYSSMTAASFDSFISQGADDATASMVGKMPSWFNALATPCNSKFSTNQYRARNTKEHLLLIVFLFERYNVFFAAH